MRFLLVLLDPDNAAVVDKYRQFLADLPNESKFDPFPGLAGIDERPLIAAFPVGFDNDLVSADRSLLCDLCLSVGVAFFESAAGYYKELAEPSDIDLPARFGKEYLWN